MKQNCLEGLEGLALACMQERLQYQAVLMYASPMAMSTGLLKVCTKGAAFGGASKPCKLACPSRRWAEQELSRPAEAVLQWTEKLTWLIIGGASLKFVSTARH